MNMATFTTYWNQLKMLLGANDAARMMKNNVVPTTYLAGREWVGIGIFYSNYDWPTGSGEADNKPECCSPLVGFADSRCTLISMSSEHLGVPSAHLTCPQVCSQVLLRVFGFSKNFFRRVLQHTCWKIQNCLRSRGFSRGQRSYA